MKRSCSVTVALVVFIAVISCKSKEQKEAENYMKKINETVKENSPSRSDDQQSANSVQATLPNRMESIIGEWKLTMMIIDKNANNKIDDDEKADPITQANDYMKLNNDESAIFSQVKMNGRWEIKPSSDGEHQYLNLFDKTDSKYSKGRIISVTKTELTLLSKSSGSTFSIWKRV